MSEVTISQEIIEICVRLYQRNMLAGADGNVSCRVSDQRILITPSGRPKAFIKPGEMAVMNIKGDIVQGNPSSERWMHIKIYQNCREARAVIHAHPPTAVAWSVARPELEELPGRSLAELILNVGRIPIVPFAMPGSHDMGAQLEKFLPEARTLILARHGALSWGETLTEALNGMERIEHTAQILYRAFQLGGLSELSPKVLDRLWEMRRELGKQST